MLERAFEEHRGRSMGSEGDSVFFVFPTARDAVLGAVTAQQRVESHGWPDGVRLRVRIGIHSGPVTISGGEYVGLTVHEVSRICGVAHGGQIVCSSSVADALRGGAAGAELRELGTFVLRGFPDGTRLFQVCAAGLDDEFPSPRDTIRAGGARMSVWFRETPGPSHAALSPADVARLRNGHGRTTRRWHRRRVPPLGARAPGCVPLGRHLRRQRRGGVRRAHHRRHDRRRHGRELPLPAHPRRPPRTRAALTSRGYAASSSWTRRVTGHAPLVVFDTTVWVYPRTGSCAVRNETPASPPTSITASPVWSSQKPSP